MINTDLLQAMEVRLAPSLKTLTPAELTYVPLGPDGQFDPLGTARVPLSFASWDEFHDSVRAGHIRIGILPRVAYKIGEQLAAAHIKILFCLLLLLAIASILAPVVLAIALADGRLCLGLLGAFGVFSVPNSKPFLIRILPRGFLMIVAILFLTDPWRTIIVLILVPAFFSQGFKYLWLAVAARARAKSTILTQSLAEDGLLSLQLPDSPGFAIPKLVS